MKQHRLITRVTGRGGELDAPLREGGEAGEGVWHYYADKHPNKCVCECECLNIRLCCWLGGGAL